MIDLTTYDNWLTINCSSKATKQTYLNQIKNFFRQYEVLNQENLNSYLASKVSIWQNTSFNLFINSCVKYFEFTKQPFELPKYKSLHTKSKTWITEEELEDF